MMSGSRQRMAWVFYGVMAAGGWLWVTAQGRLHPFVSPEAELNLSPIEAAGASIALGVILGLSTVALSRFATRRSARFRQLRDGFRELLPGLGGREVFVLALTSSVGEEILFRGAMQPVLGLWLTSLIFGAIHFIPDRRFAIWTLWAIVMGVLLGGIFSLTGNLLGPVVAHFLVNFLNLRDIAGENEPG